MNKYLLYILACFAFFSCSEEKEIFVTDTVAEYLPLQVGKVITYRLDSTIFEAGGSIITVRKYQVKHTITGITTDNKGDLSYIVQRSINNENASGSWINNGTFTITPLEHKVDVTDKNMRVTVLQGPFRKGFIWSGNSYLSTDPYQDLYNFNLVIKKPRMNQWEFVYTDFGDFSYNGQEYKNVWTVEQNNESLNMPPTPNVQLATQEISIEKYAKGIGLIYKDFQLYEYQGASSENPTPHYTGFAINMWMIAQH